MCPDLKKIPPGDVAITYGSTTVNLTQMDAEFDLNTVAEHIMMVAEAMNTTPQDIRQRLDAGKTISI